MARDALVVRTAPTPVGAKELDERVDPFQRDHV